MYRGDTITRLARYIWLMQSLTHMQNFEDFKSDWLGPEPLSRRTLSNLFLQLKEQFGIEIKKYQGVYTYVQKQELTGIPGRIQAFLLNCAEQSYKEKEKTLMEQKVILTGNYGLKTREYRIAVEALDGRKQLEFKYRHRASEPDSKMIAYRITPYGIKYYNSHWYIYGHVEHPKDTDRLDRFFILNQSRMSDCQLSREKAYIPSSIDMKASFKSYYGVITGDSKGEILPEDIELKVYKARDKHKYYNETPIHISQQGPEIVFPEKDVKAPDNYYIYRYHIAPTYDFIQKLLSDREDVEVLSPPSLRQQMKDIIRQMAARYED